MADKAGGFLQAIPVDLDDSLRKQATAEGPRVSWGDYARGVGSGAVAGAADLAALTQYLSRGAAGGETREYLNQVSKEILEATSPTFQRATGAKFLPDEGEEGVFDVGVGRSLGAKAITSGPSFAASVLPAALTGWALAGVGAPVAVAAGVAGGVARMTEAGMDAGGTANQIYSRIDKMTDAELQKSAPQYASYRSMVDEKTARQMYMQDVAGVAPLVAGAISATFGGLGVERAAGRWAAGEASEQAAKGFLRNVGKGAGGEAVQEFGQSGGSEMMSQVALSVAGLDEFKWRDVLNAALEGGAVGGLFGGAAGAVGTAGQKFRERARANENRVKEEGIFEPRVREEPKSPEAKKDSAPGGAAIVETVPELGGDALATEVIAEKAAGPVSPPDATLTPEVIGPVRVDPTEEAESPIQMAPGVAQELPTQVPVTPTAEQASPVPVEQSQPVQASPKTGGKPATRVLPSLTEESKANEKAQKQQLRKGLKEAAKEEKVVGTKHRTKEEIAALEKNEEGARRVFERFVPAEDESNYAIDDRVLNKMARDRILRRAQEIIKASEELGIKIPERLVGEKSPAITFLRQAADLVRASKTKTGALKKHYVAFRTREDALRAGKTAEVLSDRRVEGDIAKRGAQKEVADVNVAKEAAASEFADRTAETASPEELLIAREEPEEAPDVDRIPVQVKRLTEKKLTLGKEKAEEIKRQAEERRKAREAEQAAKAVVRSVSEEEKRATLERLQKAEQEKARLRGAVTVQENKVVTREEDTSEGKSETKKEVQEKKAPVTAEDWEARLREEGLGALPSAPRNASGEGAVDRLRRLLAEVQGETTKPVNYIPAAVGGRGVSAERKSSLKVLLREGSGRTSLLRQALRENLGDVPVYLVSPLQMVQLWPAAAERFGSPPDGYYDPNHHHIVLTTEAYRRDPETLVLHEGTHAFTYGLLTRDNRFQSLVESMRLVVMDATGLREGTQQLTYGLSSADEFLSEANSNYAFQRMLAEIELPRALRAEVEGLFGPLRPQIQTLWDVFVEIIRRFLNVPLPQYSVLDAALKANQYVEQNFVPPTAAGEPVELRRLGPKDFDRILEQQRRKEFGQTPVRGGESIATAAVKVNGQLFAADTHAQALNAAGESLGYDRFVSNWPWGTKIEKGFVTSTGRFVDREEGSKIFQKAGQGKPLGETWLGAEDIGDRWDDWTKEYVRGLKERGEPLPSAPSLQRAQQLADRARNVTTAVPSKVRRTLTKLATLDQLRQVHRGLFVDDEGDALEQLVAGVQKTQPYANKIREKADRLAQRFVDWADKNPGVARRFSSLALSATMLNVNLGPNADNKHLGKDAWWGWQAKAALPELQKQYNALTPEAQALWEEMAAYYRAEQNTRTKKLIGNILDTLEIALTPQQRDSITTQVMEGRLDDANKKLINNETIVRSLERARELRVVDGVYFPLMRHGGYVVRTYDRVADTMGGTEVEPGTYEFRASTKAEARRLAKAFAEKVYRNDDILVTDFHNSPDTATSTDFGAQVTVQLEGVHFFDTVSEAAQFIRENKANFANISSEPMERRATGYESGDLSGSQLSSILASIRARLPGDGNKAKRELIEQMVGQAATQLMAGNRIQQRSITRRNVQGASTDLARNLLQYGEASSRYAAKLEYGPEIRKTWQRILDIDKSDPFATNRATRTLMINELDARIQANVVSRTEPSKLVQDVMTVSYLHYLFSPAWNIINSMQPSLVTFPVLAGRFGAVRSGSEIARAYSLIGAGSVLTSGVRNTADAVRNWRKAATDPKDILAEVRSRMAGAPDGAELQAMLDALVERGAASPDSVFMVDAAISQGRGGWGKFLSRLDRVSRQLPYAVETNNRVVTAVAAYRLARGQGMSAQDATALAFDMVENTQGDYSAANAPLVFNHPVWRVALQFKKYAQMMYALLGRIAYDALRGATPEERAAARKQFAWMVGVQVLVAGALGIPGAEILKLAAMAAAVAGIGGGYDDLEREVRRALAAMVGAKPAELALKGVLPRAVGIDLSSRVGMDSLLTFGEPKKYERESALAYLATTAAGAPGSMVFDAFSAARAFADGEVLKGVSKTPLPKIVTDLAKAVDRATSGRTSERTGKRTAEPIGVGEAVVNTLGFRTARQAEETAAQGAKYSVREKENSVRQDVSKLKNQFAEARNEGERVRVLARLKELNRKLPEDERVMPSDLKKFAKNYARDERKGLIVEGGYRARTREGTRSLREAEAPYNR